jgi:hypothetical protein
MIGKTEWKAVSLTLACAFASLAQTPATQPVPGRLVQTSSIAVDKAEGLGTMPNYPMPSSVIQTLKGAQSGDSCMFKLELGREEKWGCRGE